MKSEYNSSLDELFADKRLAFSSLSTEDEDRVISFLVSIGTSFPTEISRQLLLTIEQVNALLMKLIKKGYVETMLPDPLYPQPLIAQRIPELQRQGINSYSAVTSRSWFIVSEYGIWYFLKKFRGQHRRCNSAYIKTYDLELD